MIPIGDHNPTQRSPVVTIALLVVIGTVWLFVQGGSFDATALAASVCNWGMVPGELTGRSALGAAVPIGAGLYCVVDADAINVATPLTSMFLHGGWAHVLGNALFLWVFGDNVEDRMGRVRFLLFYLVCGLAAAAVHTLVNPASAIPVVGASGAISGILGAYLMIYPHARVRVLVILLFYVEVTTLPAWTMLLYWFVLQLVSGLPQLSSVDPEVSSGVAFWAHIGGFLTGVILVRLFVPAVRWLPAKN